MFAAAAVVPLLWRAGWYSWVDLVGAPRGSGAALFALRVSFVLAIAMTLGTYDAVVRGPDRGVVDLHPLLARPYLRARVRRVLIDRASWIGVGAVLCAPIAVDPVTALSVFLVVVGAAFAGVGLGLGVNLAAARIAGNAAWGPVLDAIRGSNPREQAPFLYAPGLAVTLAGAAALAATEGLDSMISGGAPWLLAAPWAAGVVGLAFAYARAEDLSRLPAVLGEIDARWAGVEQEEDARRVYLEWVAERGPAGLREELRKELRHGWRGHRSLVLGGWGLGAFAGAVVLAMGARWLAVAACGAMVVTAAVGPRMSDADPPLLERLYPRPNTRVARSVAIFCWLAPAALLPMLAAGTGSTWSAIVGVLAVWFVTPPLAARLGVRSYLPVALGLGGLCAGVG